MPAAADPHVAAADTESFSKGNYHLAKVADGYHVAHGTCKVEKKVEKREE